MRHTDFARLARVYGIELPMAMDYIKPEYAHDYALAMDAQPALVSVTSGGIPSYLANYIDPKLIEVLLTSNDAAVILGDKKVGDWTTLTSTFPFVERVGESTSYGDHNNSGNADANLNFPQRQSYHFQTMGRWGERQLEIAGLAKIDWASQISIASAVVLDKTQNDMGFFGVAGLQNYGLLNDPTLFAPLTPSIKTETTTTSWDGADALEIYADIQRMFKQLQVQSGGVIKAKDKLVLSCSPEKSTNLTNTNQFNVQVYDTLKKAFPNIRFETATQYTTTAGDLVQLMAEEVRGQKTGTTAYTEKLRAHTIEKKTSSFVQKKSAGGWGSIIWQPFAIVGMLGI